MYKDAARERFDGIIVRRSVGSRRATLIGMPQSFMNEGIAPREMRKDVRVVDIVKGDVEMLKPTEGRRVFGKFPIYDRYHMGDAGCLQDLWATESLESGDILFSPKGRT